MTMITKIKMLVAKLLGKKELYKKLRHDAFFTPSNADFSRARTETSPSGKYALVVVPYKTRAGCWNYTQGTVRHVSSGETIAVVNRNYSSFDHLFIEGHPNGHDYLVCSEDYQGQTVIELDTGLRRDFLPLDADEGCGFCWVDYKFDAATKILVVGGCLWACPYEYRFYAFSNPLSGWPEIETSAWVDMDQKAPELRPDGTLVCFETRDDDSSDVQGDEDGAAPEAAPIVDVTNTFRRDGLTFVLVSSEVSDWEQNRRIERKLAREKYDEKMAVFKASDPLYLNYAELVKDAALSPEDHCSIGITHDGWCPDFKVEEQRYCRRIVKSKKKRGTTVDLEWGMVTGPIKLVVCRDGNKAEDKFFEHSVQGMRNAFALAKECIR
jgi:hypothetical protein